MDSIDVATLQGWAPVRVLTGGSQPLVEWARVGARLSDPFFEQTADRAMRQPFNQVFSRRTPLDALDAFAERYAETRPAGFVFHMSRCGSTLIAQMLAQLAFTTVLSEPQPLDALVALRRTGRFSDERLVRSMRGLIAALAASQSEDRRLFVKFHAWHVLELPWMLRAFPGVPWIFVFREPRAVLRSQAVAPGAEAIAGTIDPAYLGLDRNAATALVQDEYGARTIAAFCEAALRGADLGCGRFVDYATLPEAAFATVLPWFGIVPDTVERARMRAASETDTKRPGSFSPRDARPAPEIDRLAARWLDPLVDALRTRAASR